MSEETSSTSSAITSNFKPYLQRGSLDSFQLNSEYLLNKKTSDVTSDELNEFTNIFHGIMKNNGYPIYMKDEDVAIHDPKSYCHTKIGKLTMIQACYYKMFDVKHPPRSTIDTTYEIIPVNNNNNTVNFKTDDSDNNDNNASNITTTRVVKSIPPTEYRTALDFNNENRLNRLRDEYIKIMSSKYRIWGAFNQLVINEIEEYIWVTK